MLKTILSERGALKVEVEDIKEIEGKKIVEIVRSGAKVKDACALFPIECKKCHFTDDCPFYPFYKKFEDFSMTMLSKYLKALNKEGNTPEPWKDFDIETLEKRLTEELNEFYDEGFLVYYWASPNEDVRGAKKKMLDELIDIANFCLFLWVKLREDLEEV